MIQLPQLTKIRSILTQNSTIAIAGLSPKTERPSNMVARYLIGQGYVIIPVNPGQEEILGLKCYADLQSIPGEVDIVNIFRRSEDVLPIVQSAVVKKARVIWMQEGVINQEAAKLAEQRGMTVIMDRCIKTDHQLIQAAGKI